MHPHTRDSALEYEMKYIPKCHSFEMNFWDFVEMIVGRDRELMLEKERDCLLRLRLIKNNCRPCRLDIYAFAIVLLFSSSLFSFLSFFRVGRREGGQYVSSNTFTVIEFDWEDWWKKYVFVLKMWGTYVCAYVYRKEACKIYNRIVNLYHEEKKIDLKDLFDFYENFRENLIGM